MEVIVNDFTVLQVKTESGQLLYEWNPYSTKSEDQIKEDK